MANGRHRYESASWAGCDEHNLTRIVVAWDWPLRTEDARWKLRMRLLVQRSYGAGNGSGLPGDDIVRKRRVGLFYQRVSRFNSSLTRSLLRGQCDARRHCVVLLSGLLSQNRSGPLSRMHDLALGSRAHSHGFAQV